MVKNVKGYTWFENWNFYTVLKLTVSLKFDKSFKYEVWRYIIIVVIIFIMLLDIVKVFFCIFNMKDTLDGEDWLTKEVE